MYAGSCEIMNETLKTQLQLWAAQYHCAAFIMSDPVQFPHRYAQKQDIEISALLTAIMSFGNRTQIIKKANLLHDTMGASPLAYVLSGQWRIDFPASDTNSYYRMLNVAQFHSFFARLYNVYKAYDSLENALLQQYSGSPMERICAFLDVSAKSPQKKLNMFLRWMIRRDSCVDFGLWTHFDASELIIPLDTHVCRVAYTLGLTESESFSLANAKRITAALGKVFPGDPCLGDFALFGSGVNQDIEDIKASTKMTARTKTPL